MPLSEFLRMARKNELSQQKACPTNLSSRPGNDFVELVWENGQIMMQGQSSRATTNLPPNPSKAGESRILNFGGPDSISNNISPIVVPSDEFNLSQDDEMVPWLDALVQDYSSVLLPEISGFTGNNGMSAQNSFQSGVSKLEGPSLPLPPQHHHQTSDALGSGVSDINNNNYDNNNRRPDVQIIRPPTNNSNSSNHLNFSHFARPANLVKPKISSSGVESNQVKITPVANCVQPVGNEVKDSCPAKRTENLCQEKNDKLVNPSNTSDLIKCGEQIVEPIVASSSVGSGNSGGRVSCEQTLNSKRKFRDTEESECRSDDVDTESVGVKRSTHAQGNGSKRSRASEVHNLSERRRRDRINEKMRALQELIPNCNKADKASMLDEAIEYLKTLQLQVQIMSMGAGLCMPQMMFTPGMQHIHPAHIPHFPPMGMGMGFGMGMLDMNIGSPVFPVSPLQQPYFPANIQRMPGGPVYGHPSQGFPNSSMGLSGFRNGGQNVVLNTSPVLNSGVIANTNSQMNRNVEAGNSINPKSDQVHATNGVPNRSATVQENKQSTGASGPTADISKQPGGH